MNGAGSRDSNMGSHNRIAADGRLCFDQVVGGRIIPLRPDAEDAFARLASTGDRR